MSDGALYSRLLHQKKQGCPLFHPQPFDDLPRAMREIGTSIGDVGVVTPNGAFDPIFSICARAEDNRSGVPQGFEQVILPPDAIAEQRLCHPPGSDISNTTVNKKRLDVDLGLESNVFVPAGAGAVVEVSTNSKETAILLLPDGASRWDLRPVQKFRDYALKHAQSWYEFVNGNLGRMVGNGDLYLVTGVTKSTSWSVAAIEDQSGDGKVSLKLKAAQVATAGASCAWEWESTSSSVNSGPRRLPGEEVWRDNQTVFLRGFKVAVRSTPLTRRRGPKVIPVVNAKWTDLASKSTFIPFSQPRLSTGGKAPSLTTGISTSQHVHSTPSTIPNLHSLANDIPVSQTHLSTGMTSSMNDPTNQDNTSSLDFTSIGEELPHYLPRPSDDIIFFQPHLSPGTTELPYPSNDITATSFSQPRLSTGKTTLKNDALSQDNTPSTEIGEESLHYIASLPHPSDAVNEFLLACFPKAMVVVTHDDELNSVLTEADDVLPDNAELIRRILARILNCDLKFTFDGGFLPEDLQAPSDAAADSPATYLPPPYSSAEDAPRPPEYIDPLESEELQTTNSSSTVLPERGIYPVLACLGPRHSFHFDLTLPAANVKLPAVMLDEYATSPPLPSFAVTHPRLFWKMTIKPEQGKSVRVRDVLNGIYLQLRAPVTAAEYGLLPTRAAQGEVTAAFTRRWKRMPDLGTQTVEKHKGLKRVDFLGSAVVFCGLRPSRQGWEMVTVSPNSHILS